VSGVATFSLIGIKRPFASDAQNRAEMMMEGSIILLSYHMFCFTNWLDDLQMKHAIGYSLIACVLG